MNYQDYTVEDFLDDASFRHWVLDPTTDSGVFWQRFPEEYPEKIVEFRAAREFVKTLGEGVENHFPNPEAERVVLAKIRREMDAEQKVTLTTRPVWWRFAAAASVVAMLALGYLYRQVPVDEISYAHLRQKVESQLVERINETDKPLLVNLADGSLVFLKPDSRISYTESFDDENLREVFLSGEAYFEVTKNPKKPFVVYANELVTKVLGTSFNVKAYEDEEDITVKVNSGKVSVAVADEVSARRGVSKREREGIVLLPNQQATLSRRDIRLVKELIENPVPLPGESRAAVVHSFKFENARVSDVFAAIEKAYGVDIVYDAEVFADCLFNGDLTDESLFQKLNVLCLSIEAEYRMLDAQIIVSGDGCGSSIIRSP